MPKTETVLDEVTIRFAGDSGDGMQLTGSQFTHTSALVGNDVSTFPDYPAEIVCVLSNRPLSGLACRAVPRPSGLWPKVVPINPAFPL